MDMNVFLTIFCGCLFSAFVGFLCGTMFSPLFVEEEQDDQH